jgi:hypothetical protein
MKKVLAAASLTLLVATSAWTQDAKPNFSGTWSVDLAKSDFGPAPPPESIVAVIDHKEPTIKIATTQKSPMGEVSNERTLTTDGKDNVSKMNTPAGETQMTSTSKWDGGKLITVAHMELQGTAITFNDSWEISGDGKVLTIIRQVQMTPGQGFGTKTVYNKQP